MADFNQNVAGAATPSGDLSELVVGVNDPLMDGEISPTGSALVQQMLMNQLMDGQVFPTGDSEVDLVTIDVDVDGSITPGSSLTLSPLGLIACLPPQYSCLVIVTPNYACVDICSSAPVGFVENDFRKIFDGAISPGGGLSSVPAPPTLLTASITPGGEVSIGVPFIWFKQNGFFPVDFDTNKLKSDTGFCPTHTNGVFTGHLGTEYNRLLSNDYDVSMPVHLHQQSDAGSPAMGGGVIARVPFSAAFNDISGYYFVFKSSTKEFRLLGFAAGGDTFSGVPFISASIAVPDAQMETTVEMRLRVRGNVITGLVNGVEVLSFTDSTYSAGGRAGIIVPWTTVTNSFVAGPWRIDGTTTGPRLYMIDTLIDTDGVTLETHTPTS